jgi:integrase
MEREPRTCRHESLRARGRLYRAGRSDKIWTVDDEAAFLRAAPAHLHLPLLLALWTGQRQGDLLRLPWSAYDDSHIRLRQGKGGARIVIPVGAPLRAALDAAPKHSTIILTNSEGKPWTSDGFRASWGKACKRAGVVGLTFHDLRGTAVTRLAIAGCTEAEIATITGHSLRDVRSILDAQLAPSSDPGLSSVPGGSSDGSLRVAMFEPFEPSPSARVTMFEPFEPSPSARN